MDSERKDAITAWFAALCFFLSTIEYMIPKPLPFLRLGLANLPIMLAIGVLPPRQFLALVLAKIIGQGLVGRNHGELLEPRHATQLEALKLQ